MADVPSGSSLILALNRGLWGEVHPQLRQASIEADAIEMCIRIRFEYDGEPLPEVQESCSCAAGECIGDFSSDWNLEEQHVPCLTPDRPKALQYLVYRRWEPEHAV